MSEIEYARKIPILWSSGETAMRRVLAVLLFIPALLIGGSIEASAATATTLSVRSLTLIASGAGIRVESAITCPKGFTGATGGSITQAIRGLIASGYGGTAAPVTCTGTLQTVKYVIIAQGPLAFRVGSAILSTGTSFCNADSSKCVGTQRTVVLQVREPVTSAA